MNLFPYIVADPACTALLGTAPTRFYEFGATPALEVLPYATWQITHGQPFNTLEAPGADHVSTQVDVWAADPASVRSVTAAIRSALAPHGVITFFQSGRDDTSRQFRSTLKFEFIQ